MELPRYHRITQAQIRLEAAECTQCGALHFPPRQLCNSCGCLELTGKQLSGNGQLLSFSEVFRAGGIERAMPYFVGLVGLSEGVTLYAQLTDVEPDSLVIGMEVEAVIRKVDELDQGQIFYGYKFRPKVESKLMKES